MRIAAKPALAVVGKVFLLLGLAGFLIAGSLAFFEMRSGRTERADGVIARYNALPIVAFTTTNGIGAAFVSGVRSTSMRIGDHVRVVYAPDDPSDASLDGLVGR